MTVLKCAKVPCISCPHRRDVPSGVWAASEYDKLPDYDGEIAEQAMKGATARFDCHQDNGYLCAGWVATHGGINLLALRLAHIHGKKVSKSVWDYKSPVPVFASGAEAAAHGKKRINRPPREARKVIERLMGKRKDVVVK